MISFTVTLDSENSAIVITNTSESFDLDDQNNTLQLTMTGSINGEIADYQFTAEETADFIALTPVTLTGLGITDGDYTTFPDDFYRLQITEMDGMVVVDVASQIATLVSYSYIQKSLHDKIVCTPRIIGLIEKQNIHSWFIHLEVLKVLGENPPASMEDAVVARINYLNTL